jgi:histone arginine demethylase JMJD6
MTTENWNKSIDEAKRLHRPSLRNWEVDGMVEKFPRYLESVTEERRHYEHFIPSDENAPVDIPAILDARTLTKEDFFEHYEAKEIPCVIKSIPEGYDSAEKTEPWPAVTSWDLEALTKDEELRNRRLKCGEDDDGHKVKVRLKYFLEYLRNNNDDSPLYIFDSNFDEDKYAKRILTDYQVPSYFRDDLFRFVSESRRPPYRWFLVGPKRSGTTVHIDPLGTSAWNTLIHGQKRWVLFPPHVPKRIVKGKGLIASNEDDEAVHYFTFILDRIKQKAAACQHMDEYRGFACYEFTQNSGETVFIPSGWWQ